MKKASDAERLLNSSEASQMLGVSLKTIFRYTKKGIIPFVRHGRFLRYKETSIKKMVENGWSL